MFMNQTSFLNAIRIVFLFNILKACVIFSDSIYLTDMKKKKKSNGTTFFEIFLCFAFPII